MIFNEVTRRVKEGRYGLGKKVSRARAPARYWQYQRPSKNYAPLFLLFRSFILFIFVSFFLTTIRIGRANSVAPIVRIAAVPTHLRSGVVDCPYSRPYVWLGDYIISTTIYKFVWKFYALNSTINCEKIFPKSAIKLLAPLDAEMCKISNSTLKFNSSLIRILVFFRGVLEFPTNW